jgi:hypothetical protein
MQVHLPEQVSVDKQRAHIFENPFNSSSVFDSKFEITSSVNDQSSPLVCGRSQSSDGL